MKVGQWRAHPTPILRRPDFPFLHMKKNIGGQSYSAHASASFFPFLLSPVLDCCFSPSQDQLMLNAKMLQEIVNATDQRIVVALRNKDQQAGLWLNDDPALAEVLNWIRNHH